MKKYIWLFVAFMVAMLSALAVYLVPSLGSQSVFTKASQPIQRTYLQFTTVDCVVQKAEYHQWFAGTTHAILRLTLYCEEYKTSRQLELYNVDAMEYRELKKGDTVKCIIRYVIDNNGNISNCYINDVK